MSLEYFQSIGLPLQNKQVAQLTPTDRVLCGARVASGKKAASGGGAKAGAGNIVGEI